VGTACTALPSGSSSLAVTIQYNHRWTQIDTDKDYSKPCSSGAGIHSPDSDSKQGESGPESGPGNLCSSVCICGSLLHKYGLVCAAVVTLTQVQSTQQPGGKPRLFLNAP
jgi:hypothetical protein